MTAQNTPSSGDPFKAKSANGEDAPLDPAVERVRRKMMRLMGISVAIMMIGLMAVIGAIFYKISQSGDEKSETVVAEEQSASKNMVLQSMGIDSSVNFTGDVALPAGTSILKTEMNSGQILMTIGDSSGPKHLWIYDLRTNRVFSKISIH